MPEQTEYQYNYELLNHAYELCKMRRHEYVFPEHLLYMMVGYIDFQTAVHTMGGRVSSITYNLNNYFETLDKVPGTEDYEPDISVQLHEILRNMPYQEHPSELTNATYLLKNLMKLKDSYAAYVLTKEVGGESKVEDFLLEFQKEVAIALLDNAFGVDDTPSNVSLQSQNSENSLTVCMNDMLEGRPPLIGREAELERTIEVLCRKDKNNPLHVGEPGVGKTALVWGLVRKIVNGDVPKRLKHSQVFMLDVGTLVAQSQYRGEMEKALQTEMDLIGKTPGSIVYIDNIHTLVGAGRNNDSALDATDILKPYLDSGNIRFIGTTTYNEQKRFIERNQGLARRFQQIEIKEPEINEAIDILTQLKPLYEDFHKVHYSNEVINFAVQTAEQLTSELAALRPACIYVPLEVLFRHGESVQPFVAEGSTVVAVLPSVACGDGECTELRTMLAQVRESGVEEVLTGNLGLALIASQEGFALRGDLDLGVMNGYALRVLGGAGFMSATLSPELSLEQIRAMSKPINTEMVVYGRLPAMVSETCLIKESAGRCSCTTPAQMADTHGGVWPVTKHFGCRNTVWMAKKLWMEDLTEEWIQCGLWAVRLNFSTESPRECLDVANAYIHGAPYHPNGMTRGAYLRGVE